MGTPRSDADRRPRALWISLAALFGLFLFAVSLSVAQTKKPIPQEAKVTQTKTPQGGWKEVDRLINEQKFQEAAKAVEKIRLDAQKRGDGDEWTRALIKEVQLGMGLHGYETTVRFLKEQPWPEGALNRAALNLFYARCLVTYARAYSWEINQREKVESKGPVDLKAWTRDQIYAEAQKAYGEVWAKRAALGREPLKSLGEYLDPNTYPEGIRGTLRDAVSYLYVDLLADTAFWRPEESNEIFRLDLKSLLSSGGGVVKDESLQDPAFHPLQKIAYVLQDLESWHAENGQREAALESRLERLKKLWGSFTESYDRAAIRADLEKRLPSYRDVPWWAMGQAVLAGWVQEGDSPKKLVKAHDIAEAGYKAYPKSVGGELCFHTMRVIEAPDFQVTSMAEDGAAKRSIQIQHKNLKTLYFRAFPLDLRQRVESVKDYNLLPGNYEQQEIMKGKKPAASWQAELPETPDFENHKTFVTPPMREPGLYVVACSAKQDFSSTAGNRILGVNFLVTDLVLLTVKDTDTTLEVRALSGESGSPLSGVDLGLYQYNWQKGHTRVETLFTDTEGSARFTYKRDRENASYFVLARKGDQVALLTAYLSFYRPSEPREVTASFIYTDRSIYRPSQKLFFKVLVFKGRESGSAGGVLKKLLTLGASDDGPKFAVAPSSTLSLSLIDPNGEKVDTALLTTNEYGTASGEFTVPTGRLLGQWRLESSLSGSAYVRVEEYKRPTFEAAFKDPESPLRLNKPATLKGEVKYYFGLPVVNGTVKYRITREPVYPWWWEWYWWGYSRPASAQTVATGLTKLSEEGTFTITFTPEADERQAGAKSLTYRYKVSADVTDEGGETRSAAKSFRLGFVAVEARFDADAAFFQEGVPGAFEVVRTDLNGVPRKGTGSWRLTALQQPARTVPPADLPLPGTGEKKDDEAYRTPGDLLRPRWSPGYNYTAELRAWADGPEKGKGALNHDEKGVAKLALPVLPPGAYRIAYETVDDFGTPYEDTKEFLVGGARAQLALPALLLAEQGTVTVGGKARFLALSGLPDQPLTFEVWRGGELSERRSLSAGKDATLIEIPITEALRGGFSVRLSALRDFQVMQFDTSVYVPWDNKQLKVDFASFRDRIRPGGKETWKVTVKGPAGSDAAAAELLAYMYDRSLDVFASHNPPNPTSVYPSRMGLSSLSASLGSASGQWIHDNLVSLPGYTTLQDDRLKFYDGYGVGGPGRRRYAGGATGAVDQEEMAMPSAMPPPCPPAAAPMAKAAAPPGKRNGEEKAKDEAAPAEAAKPEPQAPEEKVELRTDFSETAFWKPHLLLEKDGSTSIEFTVPDSVTSWNVWVHAVTKDLKAGALHKETRSVKDLMVRPYVPRFLREGDRAELKVVVNNASEKEMKGRVTFDVLDPETNESLLKSFGLAAGDAVKPFTVKAGGGANLTFPITAPVKVGTVAFKVIASSGDLSDGELRPLPVLPGRMHLAQSRFVVLKNKDRREMTFDDMKRADDPSLVNEQLVVTLDAQLFYSVLSATPYLINYPYECTEQTLNRFVSTGILSSLYKDYPAVSKMAEEFSKRDTPLETWDKADPNRKMALEETPWLTEAKGGKDAGFGMVNVLDPRIAKANREEALAKLRKAQTSIGAFPWWPGGPPSPYMTLYILYGFSKAVEYKVDVPKDMVQRAWGYMHRHFLDEIVRDCIAKDCGWELVTFLNYVLSNYPDTSWTGGVFTDAERKRMLDFSFKHWKEHCPYNKCQLALTLKRMNRPKDAALVFESVMDSAKTTQDEGTFWAPEDRAWLWYNDTIETHAFALRTLMEITPDDAKKDGLVVWIFLNKKLNHWKSTRATAEVIYSLVHYLQKEGALGTREDATVRVCNQTVQYAFEPDKYTGKKNQTVIPGEKVDPATCSTVTVEKESKGVIFASATWQFSTEKLPEEDRGDFLSVSRTYFLRENTGKEFVLRPLKEGAVLKPGDEVEIQLAIRCKHACEYVHLRDPRAAGLEPENPVSRYKWDLGLGWYEETRDSGTNFFFEWLPQGQYTFKYRLRANMAGVFKVSPATLQSMYAPEFNAYSAGAVITVRGE